MTTPAGGNLGDATVTVNANTDPALRALNQFSRDAQGRIRDVRGRYVSEGRLINNSLTSTTRTTNRLSEAMDGLKSSSLLLSPALIPVAAQAAPIAAGMGAATVAIGAFAAAAAGQVKAITEAGEAEKKYQEAMAQHGAGSKQAGEAQAAYARQVAQMPAATRTAAAALSVLKDEYREWSDSLASSTMPVATKAFQAFSGVFPKLTPLVKGTSAELNRFVTIAGGGIASPGFDRLMQSFSTFAVSTLGKANDALIRFVATLDTGKVSGGVAQFMEYARQNGPLVRDTLSSVVEALSNVLAAASNVGPGLLTVVNALAGIVAAVPPGAITVMLQLALAIKAVKIAAAGAAGMTGLSASITAVQTAAAGATGIVPKLTAAIGALSKTAKLALAGTGIGLLVIGLAKLSEIGETAPPNVDRLTTSLGRLGATGKVSGEAAKAFGSDLDNLYEKVRNITDPSFVDHVQNGFVKIFTLGQVNSTASSDAQKALDAIDDSLVNLVEGGKINEAAAALDVLAERYSKNAGEQQKFRAEMDEYNDRLDAHKGELEIAARAQGAFGTAAQATSAKLAAQKLNADGLRAALIALNEVNQSAYGAQIQFEAAVDSLTASFKEHGATLDVDTAAGQANGQAMLAAARSQNELIASGLAAGSSLESMAGKSDKLRTTMLRLATDAFDGNKKKAQEYTNTLLGTPAEVRTLIKAERADAIAGLKDVQAEIKATPGAKSVKVMTLNAAAIAALEAVGLKTRQLPDGRTEVYTATGKSLGSIGSVGKALDNLNGKTANTYTNHNITYHYRSDGASFLGPSGRYATGGRVRRYASGGAVQAFPGGGQVDGPGTPTSDSVFALLPSGARARVSDTEYVVRGAAVRKYGVRLFDQLNAMRLPVPKLASGGPAAAGSAGRDVALGLAAGMGAATRSVEAAARAMAAAVAAGVRGELQISSPSKVMKALAKDVGKGFLSGLTGSRDKIKAVSKDLASDVRAAFSGRRESALIKMINRDTGKLMSLASKRDAIAKKLADANKFATDTASAARATGGLAGIVQQDAFSPKFVKGEMQASLNQIKAFTANVQKLQKKGLNKDLLRQILEMGPEQGAQFAKALAGADAATIKQYNSLNSQINKESGKLGKVGADLLYDSGKKAGAGFLTGLKAQQKEIEKLMMSIAKSMQKSIRKALGISSPARKLIPDGVNTARGIAVGVVRGLPHIDNAMQQVTSRVTSGARTVAVGTVPTMRTSARPAASSGDLHVHLHLQNHGVIGSQREMDDWLIRALDTVGRTNRIPAALTRAIRNAR